MLNIPKVAVATMRHWLPKREGAHASGKDLMVATATFGVYVLLYVEEEVHDVAVLNNVFLALDSELSCSSAGCFGLE